MVDFIIAANQDDCFHSPNQLNETFFSRGIGGGSAYLKGALITNFEP